MTDHRYKVTAFNRFENVNRSIPKVSCSPVNLVCGFLRKVLRSVASFAYTVTSNGWCLSTAGLFPTTFPVASCPTAWSCFASVVSFARWAWGVSATVCLCSFNTFWEHQTTCLHVWSLYNPISKTTIQLIYLLIIALFSIARQHKYINLYTTVYQPARARINCLIV